MIPHATRPLREAEYQISRTPTMATTACAGLGQFGRAYRAYRPPNAPLVIHAHNNFLELWAELGIFGLLAWLWLVGTVLIAAHRRAGWLAVAAWAFVLHNLVDFSLYVPQVNFLWWLIAGLATRSPVPSPVSDTALNT